MCNQTATPPDRVQEKNGDTVTLGVWYRRPDGVNIWSFGCLDDLVEVELKSGLVQITAVKYLSWKNTGNGAIVRARVLKIAEQMLDIIRESDAFRAHVDDVIEARRILADACADDTAEKLATCRAGVRELQQVVMERAETIKQLETQIAKMRALALDKPAPASEIEWLRSVVERTLVDR